MYKSYSPLSIEFAGVAMGVKLPISILSRSNFHFLPISKGCTKMNFFKPYYAAFITQPRLQFTEQMHQIGLCTF